MKNKAVSGIILTLLTLSVFTSTFNIQPVETLSSTITVPDDYPTIQEAINAATNGDTVYVRAGTYYENVVVNKSISLTGENPINTIIDASEISVPASNAVICNFSITRANSWAGIWLIGSNITVTGNCVSLNNIGIGCGSGDWLNPPSNITITGNNITENAWGIELGFNFRDIKISKNYIANNQYDGVFFWSEWPCLGPSYMMISENNITGNAGSGIRCDCSGSVSNIIFGNVISNNGEDGITLFCSRDHMISENRISDNAGDGIALIDRHYKSIKSEYNTVSENTVVGNLNGVSLRGSSRNNVSLNCIVGNQIGVRLDYEPFHDGCFGEQNNISENNVTGSLQFGIWVRNSSDNRVYHNSFIDNENSSYSENSTNIWDDGYPSGGNYWSGHVTVDDYSGINQDELGSDGIVDEPYIIDDNNRDNYPLVEPWSPVISATIDINLGTLNLRSKGRWITAYIELPEDYSVGDIDIYSIMLNDTLPVSSLPNPPVPVPTEIGDYDEDGIPDLMVKFDRALVQSFIYSQGVTHGEVSLTITGELLDGTGFEGTDVISVKYGGGPGCHSALAY